MATDVCRPPISGGPMDARRSSTSLFHGTSKSLSASPPAFGDIPTSFIQGKGVLEEDPSSNILKNKDLFRVRELATSEVASISPENDPVFSDIQISVRSDSEILIADNNKGVQDKENSKSVILNNSVNEGIRNQGSIDLENVRVCNNGELGSCKETVNVMDERNPPILHQNSWAKKEHIKVSHLEFGEFRSEDGISVKLNVDKVKENSKKLQNSIVIKVFGSKIPFPVVSTELRRQWTPYGKFHLTMLGMDWILCSFYNNESLEAVFNNGPWFVNGKIIGMDKWSPNFDPSSLKGLSAPIWIRLPNLPLLRWDEINICRIASTIGQPLMIDGNLFQWGRREFGRVCVRIKLDIALPKGTWVESSSGKFYQKFEYERIPEFCFCCGKIGHDKSNCSFNSSVTNSVSNKEGDPPKNTEEITFNNKVSKEAEKDNFGYGPWLQVNYGKKRNLYKNQGFKDKVVDGNNIPDSVSKKQIWKEVEALEVPNKVVQFATLEGVQEDPINESVCLQHSEISSKIILDKRSNVHNSSFISSNKFNLLDDISEEGEIISAELVDDLACKILEEVSNNSDKGIINKEDLSNGLSGGILVLWKGNFASFKILDSSSQFIVGDLEILNKGTWRIASIYGSKDVYRRRLLWERLEFFTNKDIPMVIGGDFNCILSSEDKRGGKRFKLSQGPKEMKTFLANNDLHEVGFVGPKFTWCNNKQGPECILERLDKCFINPAVVSSSNLLCVKHLACVASDQCPIVLNLMVYHNKEKILRFEDVWAQNKASMAVVNKVWKKKYRGNAANILNSKMKDSLKSLFYWSKSKMQNLLSLKNDLLFQIENLQKKEANEGCLSIDESWKLKALVGEFNSTLAKLDTWWKQRAKVKWMVEGDRNSKFFQSFASSRRNSNFISKIKNDVGEVVEEQKLIVNVFLKHFQDKWKLRRCILEDRPSSWCCLNEDDKTALNKPFSIEEMEIVIKNSGNNISQGQDGITFSFFKAYWEIIKLDLWNAIKEFFENAVMDPKWKETIVVLIPKINNPLSPSNYRPISLCNSVYKLVAKILMNRMAPYISKLISYEQVAFIKGRSLNDHVLIAQEVIHKLRNSKSSKGFVVFKIDMEQAYDSMGWTTLEKDLHYFGFPEFFSKLILNCIQSSKFSISINGSLSKWIEGQCGFRQGCPLSPFLFIICAQLLSNAFRQKGDELGIRISSNGPSISHLLYADDVIIFSEATLKATKQIKKILDNFCSWTALKMTNIWGSKMISLAGKILLAKTVLLSFTTFHCTNSLVPKSILDEVDKICRNFIWNKSNGDYGIHYVNRLTMCLATKWGGRALHSCSTKLGPIRSKLTWKYLYEKDSFIHKVFFPKYGNLLEKVDLKNSCSNSWKILKSGGKSLLPFIRWKVANGIDIDVYKDTWILDKSLNKWPTFISPIEDDIFSVSNFIENGRWNVDQMRKIMGEDLVNLILQTINPLDQEDDKMELLLQGNGKSLSAMVFENSVKHNPTAYYCSWIKNAKLNPKVETFWWRIFNNALATNDFLEHRKFQRINLCPRNCNVAENRDHLTTNCQKLKEVISKIKEWGFSFKEYHTLQDCCKDLSSLNPFMINLYCSMVFLTWKSRNNLLYNEKDDSTLFIASNAISFASISIQGISKFSGIWDVNQPSRLSLSHWYPPPPDWHKVNVDATLLSNYKAGIGGIFRDHKGRFLLAFGKPYIHWDIYSLELFATQHIKEEMKDWMFKFKGIIIEGDNHNVMEFLKLS
ncbi:uncharacterized protein LOC114581249 [Dendrobium catenatum]|uniref:uncharacterized protein LOC114581249 n=1 Tax=Dendrobium catenatum TaxID=906689 RepID=UPI00109F0D6E|nr:uncharacterized protein LOC114581249 [Dendrobium catenatum]